MATPHIGGQPSDQPAPVLPVSQAAFDAVSEVLHREAMNQLKSSCVDRCLKILPVIQSQLVKPLLGIFHERLADDVLGTQRCEIVQVLKDLAIAAQDHSDLFERRLEVVEMTLTNKAELYDEVVRPLIERFQPIAAQLHKILPGVAERLTGAVTRKNTPGILMEEGQQVLERSMESAGNSFREHLGHLAAELAHLRLLEGEPSTHWHLGNVACLFAVEVGCVPPYAPLSVPDEAVFVSAPESLSHATLRLISEQVFEVARSHRAGMREDLLTTEMEEDVSDRRTAIESLLRLPPFSVAVEVPRDFCILVPVVRNDYESMTKLRDAQKEMARSLSPVLSVIGAELSGGIQVGSNDSPTDDYIFRLSFKEAVGDVMDETELLDVTDVRKTGAYISSVAHAQRPLRLFLEQGIDVARIGSGDEVEHTPPPVVRLRASENVLKKGALRDPNSPLSISLHRILADVPEIDFIVAVDPLERVVDSSEVSEPNTSEEEYGAREFESRSQDSETDSDSRDADEVDESGDKPRLLRLRMGMDINCIQLILRATIGIRSMEYTVTTNALRNQVAEITGIVGRLTGQDIEGDPREPIVAKRFPNIELSEACVLDPHCMDRLGEILSRVDVGDFCVNVGVEDSRLYLDAIKVALDEFSSRALPQMLPQAGRLSIDVELPEPRNLGLMMGFTMAQSEIVIRDADGQALATGQFSQETKSYKLRILPMSIVGPLSDAILACTVEMASSPGVVLLRDLIDKLEKKGFFLSDIVLLGAYEFLKEHESRMERGTAPLRASLVRQFLREFLASGPALRVMITPEGTRVVSQGDLPIGQRAQFRAEERED